MQLKISREIYYHYNFKRLCDRFFFLLECASIFYFFFQWIHLYSVLFSIAELLPFNLYAALVYILINSSLRNNSSDPVYSFLGLDMAFVNRIGNVLKQRITKHINVELSASNLSLFQTIRSMSSSKLFVGGEMIVPFLRSSFCCFLHVIVNLCFLGVGLSYGTDEMSLNEAFSQHGEVVEGIQLLVSCLLSTI